VITTLANGMLLAGITGAVTCTAAQPLQFTVTPAAALCSTTIVPLLDRKTSARPDPVPAVIVAVAGAV
jgi:hypothetical protein